MVSLHCGIMIRHTCHFFDFQDSRLFKTFDVLLDHVLKGLVVDEPWQFSSTVLSFVLSYFSLNIPVDCNMNEFVKEKVDVK